MMDSQKSLGTGDSTAARPFNRLTHTLSRPDQSDRDALHEDHLKSEGKSRADTAPPNQPVTQTIGPAASSGAFPVSSPASAALPATDVKSLQRSVLASEPSIQKVNRVIHRPPLQYRDQIVSRAFQADYGWLADMLHTKVETLKRYPYVAKSNRWQGNVVLQAAIHENGHISDILIVQTSGHAVLDQDAVMLLEQASPVTLEHQLNQASVIVHIPIGYRLE
jgi:protein TonB